MNGNIWVGKTHCYVSRYIWILRIKDIAYVWSEDKWVTPRNLNNTEIAEDNFGPEGISQM